MRTAATKDPSRIHIRTSTNPSRTAIRTCRTCITGIRIKP
jgi:hypothetical protein